MEEIAPYYNGELYSVEASQVGQDPDNYGTYTGVKNDEEGYALAVQHPEAFSKHVDPDTGYWFYESLVTGERHWDRPLAGVRPLEPKYPSAEDELVDDARIKRQRSERESRQNDMAQRRAWFDRVLSEEGKKEECKEVRRVTALWDEADQHAARKGGDFSLAWVDVPGVSEGHLFGFHERHGGTRIVNLRLVGLGLNEVPGAIGRHLWSLMSLSLSSNLLQEIPEGLCDLTALTDLNLVRNRLTKLPDRFGNLLRLKNLSLAGNRLESIPPSFGNLLRLDRVVLDCNSLRRLPETLGRMKCRWLNVSNNKLAGLPHCLKEMSRLIKISAVNNGLRSLPSDIGDSTSLTALHLASNRLNQLPDSICRLKTLKVLWLDHNFIAGLPMMFHQLSGLERLMLEHNDMVYPPSDVIQQGCDRVRAWCRRREHDRVTARQHTIVMAVQDILKQIRDRGLGDPSCFEPCVEVEGDVGKDHFYALIYERFWDTMLPALELDWETGPAPPRGAVTSFAYSREEVDAVLMNYRDPTGRVLRTKTQMFRRCSCMGTNGRRRVCVPPKAGWMCERKATLIKHDIILEREQEERRRLALEREDIEFRIALARRLVKEGSETIEGKKAYSRKAIRMAEELKKKKQIGEFQSGAEAMKAHRRQNVEKKFAKLKGSLNKEREHRLQDLKLKVAGLREELETLRGWGKEQKEAQIDQVLASMASLPEDAKLTDVEQQLEEEVQKLEEKAAAAAAQKARKVMNKKVKRGDREFQELVGEMVVDLVQQDMEAAGEAARRKAEKEHEVFRRIVAMWVGLGMRESFAEWKVWTKKRITRRRKDARKALREAWHDYETEGVVSVMAEWKASFWQEEYDVYTDTEIWRHKDTGEVRTVRPKVEDFIPEGYEMPKPPSKRLEDMSDSSSSGSSSASGSAGEEETAGRPRRRGGALDGGSSGSSSPSTSSGWSFTSSSGDEDLEESNDEGEMPSEATGGSGSSSSSSSTAPASPRLGETAAVPAPSSSTGSADGRSSGSSSHSKSGFGTSSSSADASGASSETSDGEDSAGTSEESSRAPTPPLLGLSDGRENGATSSESTSRSTAKRTSTDGQTASTTLVTDADSAEAVALQITSGGALETEGERKELAIVTAGEKNVHSSGTGASSSRGSAPFVKGGRRGSTSGGKGHSRRKSRPTSKGLTVFIKDKTAEAYQKMEKLIQASEDDSSSHPSSLRTEKSLQRQREWEINHARVRAQQLREERLQEYQQEAKIRREMAAVEAGSLSSSEPPQQSLDEVMESVGWDPDGTYTNKEVEAFAEKAMATLKDLGKDANVELSKFGNTAF